MLIATSESVARMSPENECCLGTECLLALWNYRIYWHQIVTGSNAIEGIKIPVEALR